MDNLKIDKNDKTWYQLSNALYYFNNLCQPKEKVTHGRPLQPRK